MVSPAVEWIRTSTAASQWGVLLREALDSHAPVAAEPIQEPSADGIVSAAKAHDQR